MKRQHKAQSRFSKERGFINPAKTDSGTDTDMNTKTDTSTNSRNEADTNTDTEIDIEYWVITIHVSRDRAHYGSIAEYLDFTWDC